MVYGRAVDVMEFRQNKWLRRLVTWVLVPVALVYGFFQYNYPTCTFRYKLTAEVMTPDGLKTGSSVIEVSYSSVHPLPNPGRWRSDTVTGEAVFVDLGHGKNLFVLLGADHWDRLASYTPSPETPLDPISAKRLGEGSLNVLWLPIYTFNLGRAPGEERLMSSRVNSLRGQLPIQVPLSNIPLIGSFGDMHKPETFVEVSPTEISKVMGEGFVLRSVSVQIVNETTGTQIKSALPWLDTLHGGLRKRTNLAGPDILASIGQTYFISSGYRLEI
jgi:hypothetical protein